PEGLMACSATVRSPTAVRTWDASVRAPGLVAVHVQERPGSHFVTSQMTVGSFGWRMRALAPRRMGPSMSSTDVNDDAHVGHRSTSVKTFHTTSIGASIVMEARSTACSPIADSSLSLRMMYQMVHQRREAVKRAGRDVEENSFYRFS